MYDTCIVGAGVAGLITLLLLAEAKTVPLESILLVDPYFDGGDLNRRWGTVISNTPWSATFESLKTYLPSFHMPVWAAELPLDRPTPLHQITRLLRELARPLLSRIRFIQGSVISANYTTAWGLTILRESQKEPIRATRLILTTGATPKLLDLPIPTIPLEVALDLPKLKTYIQPASKVLVFGTAHSGTLILKNLVDASAAKVTAIYRGVKPFLFARDGEYDGIKMDAATIADTILKGDYPQIELAPSTSLSTIIRESQCADWIVYAIGFQPRTDIVATRDGIPLSLTAYDGSSGKLTECPNAWGFGVAYPSQAPDGIHWDVGVSSFLEHIAKSLSQKEPIN